MLYDSVDRVEDKKMHFYRCNGIARKRNGGCEVVVFKTFSKRALGATTPKFGCGVAAALPVFPKCRYDNLVYY